MMAKLSKELVDKLGPLLFKHAYMATILEWDDPPAFCGGIRRLGQREQDARYSPLRKKRKTAERDIQRMMEKDMQKRKD